jgi:hypothetical protein
LLLKRQLLQRTLGYLQFIQWLFQAPLSSDAACRGLMQDATQHCGGNHKAGVGMDLSAPPCSFHCTCPAVKLPDSLCVDSMVSNYNVAMFVLVSCVLRNMISDSPVPGLLHILHRHALRFGQADDHKQRGQDHAASKEQEDSILQDGTPHLNHRYVDSGVQGGTSHFHCR